MEKLIQNLRTRRLTLVTTTILTGASFLLTAWMVWGMLKAGEMREGMTWGIVGLFILNYVLGYVTIVSATLAFAKDLPQDLDEQLVVGGIVGIIFALMAGPITTTLYLVCIWLGCYTEYYHNKARSLAK